VTRTAATLGVDLGTGSVKAELLTANGRVLAGRRVEYPMSTPGRGVAEIEVDSWWRAVGEAVGGLLASRDVELAGIGLSGQMHGVVLLDDKLTALAPAITWADTRSAETVAEVAELAAPFKPALANPVVPGMAAVMLRWLRSHRPELLDRSWRVLQPKDWLGARLTGEPLSDPTDASATLLWDFAAGDWHRDLLLRLDLDPALLPEVAPSDATRGRLRPDAASELGAPAGTPVTVGRADTAAALVGSGAATRAGTTQLSIGTGGQLCHVLDAFRPDPSQRTHLYHGPGSDQWYAMAATLSAGLAMEWVRRLHGVTWADLYQEAFACAPGAGGVVFLPYVAGERTPHLDPTLSAGWYGLRLHHERADVFRSALEGCAFALRDAFDALVDAGHDTEAFLLTGGGSHDRRWRQLLADVLERPLAVAPNGGGSARGAALSAAIGAGWFDNLGTAAATAGPPAIVTAPNPAAYGWVESLTRFRELVGCVARHESRQESM
jgi:xylulokinase